MNENTVIKFSVDKIDFVDEVNNSLFRRARIHAFASGKNAHTLPIDEDVLKRGAETIYNKPILWKYDKYLDDAMGHEKDEVPCGFIPKEDNPITFEKSEDGRIFIVIDALIWTKYSGKLIEIFERADNKKDVSIEIVILDADNTREKPRVLDFIIAGITILGEWINPACKGCQAELLAFSEDKTKYEEQYFADAISIDNSAEAATSGEWKNPRRKLFKAISQASNYKSLFKEAYLINDSIESESSLSEHKYPHHVLIDGKLVVHKDGLMAAFQRAAAQGIVSGNIRTHLLRHYKELGLDTENFSEQNKLESVGDTVLANEKDLETKEFGNENIEAVAQEAAIEVEEKQQEDVVAEVEEAAAEESIIAEEKAPEIVTDSESSEKELSEEFAEATDSAKDEASEQPEDAENKEEPETVKESEEEVKCEDDSEEHGECEEEHEEHEDEVDFEELKVKFAELTEENAKLKADNEAYMSKIAEMSDYEELKQFKADAEAKAKQEAEMACMNKVMSDIEARGVQMSAAEKEELMGKFSEFSSIDAWANFAKAQVFDRAENIDGVVKMGLPYPSAKKATGSIWDKF